MTTSFVTLTRFLPRKNSTHVVSDHADSDHAESDNMNAVQPATNSTSVAAAVKPRRWFLSPAFDYFFVCGGVVWLIFAFHYIGLGGTKEGAIARTLVMVSSLGALLLAEVHTAATLVRTYGNNNLRARHFLLSNWVAFAFCGLTLIAMCTPILATSLLKLYLLFVPHHFMSQCYGMVRIYCLKQDYRIDKLENWALNTVVRTTVAYSMLRQLTYKDWSGTKFLGAEIPFWGPVPEPFLRVSEFALAAAVTLFAFALVRASLRTDRTFPLAGILTLLTGMGAFVMGQAATGIYWLYVSAFFHATQYLTVIVACKIGECIASKDEARKDSVINKSLFSRLTSSRPVATLLFTIVALSLSLYLGLPRVLQACGFDFGLALVSTFATINLLHFVLDSVLWRLRSAELRRLLI